MRAITLEAALIAALALLAGVNNSPGNDNNADNGNAVAATSPVTPVSPVMTGQVNAYAEVVRGVVPFNMSAGNNTAGKMLALADNTAPRALNTGDNDAYTPADAFAAAALEAGVRRKA